MVKKTVIEDEIPADEKAEEKSKTQENKGSEKKSSEGMAQAERGTGGKEGPEEVTVKPREPAKRKSKPKSKPDITERRNEETHKRWYIAGYGRLK